MERIGKSDAWLLEQIDQQKTVRLVHKGSDRFGARVRSAHLLYVTELSEFFVLVMDDRKRLVVTVLTEEMALKSRWREGLTDENRLRARRRAGELVPDGAFLQEYANQRGATPVNLRVLGVGKNWKRRSFTLLKLLLEPERIDVERNEVVLTSEESDRARSALQQLIAEGRMLPYGEILLVTGHGKQLDIRPVNLGIGSLSDAELARRWA